MFRNAKHRIIIAAIVFLTGAVYAISTMASGDMFIKIDGIEGESRDIEHSSWIEVESFSWEHMGISMSGQRASRIGTRQGEPAMPGSLTITKIEDKSSTSLMQVCAQGTNLDDVVVDVVETDAQTGIVQHSTYTLSGVNLSGCSSSDSDDRPIETFTLNYDKIAYKYYTTSQKTGKAGKTKR